VEFWVPNFKVFGNTDVIRYLECKRRVALASHS